MPFRIGVRSDIIWKRVSDDCSKFSKTNEKLFQHKMIPSSHLRGMDMGLTLFCIWMARARNILWECAKAHRMQISLKTLRWSSLIPVPPFEWHDSNSLSNNVRAEVSAGYGSYWTMGHIEIGSYWVSALLHHVERDVIEVFVPRESAL